MSKSVLRIYLMLCLSGFMPYLFGQNSIPDAFQIQMQHFLDVVRTNAGVDYGRVEEERALVQHMDSLIAEAIPAKWDSLARKSYFLNVYHYLVIRSIAERYPVSSVKKIPQFFKRKHRISRDTYLSLDQLEKQLSQGDPKIHLVLNCGAKGCPPLAPFAFGSRELDRVLEQYAIEVLNLPNFTKLDTITKRLKISEIFRWYEGDFVNVKDFFFRHHKLGGTLADYQWSYDEYDWQLNGLKEHDDFDPYIVTDLFGAGQYEVKIFNSLYSQIDFDGMDKPNRLNNYFSSYIQFLMGTDKGVNYGLDAVFKSNTLNMSPQSSAFLPLTFQNGEREKMYGDGQMRMQKQQYGWTHLGPKIKFIPFKSFPNIALQNTLYIPLPNDIDVQWVFFPQLFYNKPIGLRSQLFMEASIWASFAPEFRTPIPYIKAFYSYFPIRRWSVYAMGTFPVEYGIGTKYQVIPNLEIEFLYSYFLPIRSILGDIQPRTFNLGVRWSKF